MAQAPRAQGPAIAFLVLAALAALPFACKSASPLPAVDQVPADASAAFEEARAWLRGTGPAAVERARAAAQRAHEIAPDWVAPRRMLDDLLVADLRGIEALAAHLRALERDPRDAAELYLAGRLEGQLSRGRFERAARADPELSWALHGLAFAASLDQDHERALVYGERALERARDDYERAYFTSMLARYHASAERPERALAALEGHLAMADVAPVDRIELSVQMALIELSMVFQPEYRRGWARALGLLRESELSDAEVDRLVERMRLLRSSDSAASLELQLALAAGSSPARDRWRAQLLLDQSSTPLALGLLHRARESGSTTEQLDRPLWRAARFAAFQFELGVEEWLRDLPAVVLDGSGLPRDPALAAVVERARTLGPSPGAEALAEFGERLIEAGWFREARSVASALAVHDLDLALSIDDRAAAGRGLIDDLRRLMEAIDQRPGGRLTLGSLAGAVDPDRETLHAAVGVGTLELMLAAMAPSVARSQALLGGEMDESRVAEFLSRSPRLDYLSIGSVVHPGPWFRASDAARGFGKAGEPVPGLASVLAHLGRFGVFGQMWSAGGPDGTILPRVLVEERSGEHFGVPWEGTVAWCEGAELKSRAGRAGADISGAALHEGYWVDLSAVRREYEPWALLERRYRSEERARLEEALATRGLELRTPREALSERRRERRTATTLLGASDRVRLALLRDRAAAGGAGDEPLVPFDELLVATAIHEEGHLCDRTRFLPLSRHLLSAARFLFTNGFSPTGIARSLEYRAQLTALARAPDPRVPLVSILRAAEGAESGPTPHAAAYRELLDDFLWVLDRELEHDGEDYAELSPDHVLAHQLHWLPPAKLRRLAELLARRAGLDAR
jgi:hypothetical protein